MSSAYSIGRLHYGAPWRAVHAGRLAPVIDVDVGPPIGVTTDTAPGQLLMDLAYQYRRQIAHTAVAYMPFVAGVSAVAVAAQQSAAIGTEIGAWVGVGAATIGCGGLLKSNAHPNAAFVGMCGTLIGAIVALVGFHVDDTVSQAGPTLLRDGVAATAMSMLSWTMHLHDWLSRRWSKDGEAVVIASAAKQSAVLRSSQ